MDRCNLDDGVNESEAALVERLRAKDSRAFRQLYELYAPDLLQTLYRLTGQLHHAEDCLQQTFLDALRGFSSFRGTGSLRGWLYRIAVHQAMALFRKQQRFKSLMEGWRQSVEVGESPSSGLPEALFLREELREMVWHTLEQLSPQKRMAVLLCDLEGFSHEEAAQKMDLPIGTMHSRLHYGRKEFRTKMSFAIGRKGLSVGDLFDE